MYSIAQFPEAVESPTAGVRRPHTCWMNARGARRLTANLGTQASGGPVAVMVGLGSRVGVPAGAVRLVAARLGPLTPLPESGAPAWASAAVCAARTAAPTGCVRALAQPVCRYEAAPERAAGDSLPSRFPRGRRRRMPVSRAASGREHRRLAFKLRGSTVPAGGPCDRNSGSVPRRERLL